MNARTSTTRNAAGAWWYCLMALALVLTLVPDQLHAGIAVTPLKRELALRPGEQGTIDLTLNYHVRREADIADTATLSLADIAISELGAVGFAESGSRNDSASKWVRLGAQRVTLQPGESQTVRCTVTPPMSAVPGEYYSAVLVTMANRGKTEQGVAVQFRIATGIFVTVLGRTLPKSAAITHCELEWPESPAEPSTQAATPATQPARRGQPRVALVISNTGKARFEGVGKMLLLDEDGRIAYSTSLVSSRPSVFAGDTRRFEALLNKPLPVGRYTARVTLDYGSAWNKARHELPVEITPERARYLAMCETDGTGAAPLVKVAPERVAVVIPAGATRTVALAVTNASGVDARCLARLVAEVPSASDEWITVEPEDSQIGRSERKSLLASIHVPPGTPAGRYVSNLTIQTRPEGADMVMHTVPLEIEVKAEKSHG